MNFEDKIKELDKLLLESISHDRYLHSLSVMHEAVRLAKFYGVDQKKCSFAALAHDFCRELPDDQILDLSGKYRKAKILRNNFRTSISLFEEWEEKTPLFLHGAAAASKLYFDLGIEDKEILEAVEFHTFGERNIGEVAQIIFLADILEPNRKFDNQIWRDMAGKISLKKLFYTVVIDSIKFDAKMGRDTMPPLIRIVEQYQSEFGDLKL